MSHYTCHRGGERAVSPAGRLTAPHCCTVHSRLQDARDCCARMNRVLRISFTPTCYRPVLWDSGRNVWRHAEPTQPTTP